MKTLLTLTLFLLMATISKAQDFTLPKGSSNIYLQSGKIIKDVSLWRIDSVKVEYVIKGNLADIKTSAVSKIETPDFLMEFDERNQIIKIDYDLIILFPQDTIRGFIQEIDGKTISYIPAGSNKTRSVMKDDVKNYFQEKVTGLLADSAVNKKDLTRINYQTVDIEEVAINTKDPILTETDYDSISKNVEGEVVKNEKMEKFYYQQSYERGVNDALEDSRHNIGWGVGGFVLGMTVGSPFLSLAAVNSQVQYDKIPTGVDEKLYRDGYENEIVKKRARKAAAGAIAGKILLLIIVVASF